MDTISVESIWINVCAVLHANLSPSAYNTWIVSNPLTEFRLIGDDRAIGVISSPTAFHSTNIEKNFYAQIKEVLDQVTGRNTELQFRVGIVNTMAPTPSTVPLTQTNQVANFSTSYTAPSSPEKPVSPMFATHQPISDFSNSVNHSLESDNIANLQPVYSLPNFNQQQPQSINNGLENQDFSQQSTTEETPGPLSPAITSLQERLRAMAQKPQSVTSPTNSQPHRPTQHQTQISTAGDLFSPATIQTMSIDRARNQAQRAGLRLDYTFDTFAVSTTNEMAHAAAMAVSTQPGTAYNPLFIYGGVGVGKTHLMHAVGNNILKNNPEVKLLYCTGEDFTNEIVNAIQTKRAMLFKEKFRTVDILLIDDVQFIAGKNTVQEEFFHTFNTVTKRFGQVILTSDRPPQEISLLEDRIRSRFEAGLMVDIQQPSFELRTAIVLIKANSYQFTIPMNLAQIIASKVDSARKIEGLMKSIKSEVELKHREISLELIEEVLKIDGDSKTTRRMRVKPFDLIRVVADYYHIKQVAIKGKQRVQAIVRARHVAMYFMKNELNIPYEEIGRWFSNRDHTSAMHGFRKIEAEINIDDDLRREVNELRDLLIKISR